MPVHAERLLLSQMRSRAVPQLLRGHCKVRAHVLRQHPLPIANCVTRRRRTSGTHVSTHNITSTNKNIHSTQWKGVFVEKRQNYTQEMWKPRKRCLLRIRPPLSHTTERIVSEWRIFQGEGRGEVTREEGLGGYKYLTRLSDNNSNSL